jgi:hypothetical protein
LAEWLRSVLEGHEVENGSDTVGSEQDSLTLMLPPDKAGICHGVRCKGLIDNQIEKPDCSKDGCKGSGGEKGSSSDNRKDGDQLEEQEGRL